METLNHEGRYLKALVDRPESIGAKKGDLFLIIKHDNTIKDIKDNVTWFYCKSKIGTTWELMPEGFDPTKEEKSELDLKKEALLEEAHKKYPVGTEINCLHNCGTHVIESLEEFQIDSSGGCIRVREDSRCVYDEDRTPQWAEHVNAPKSNSTTMTKEELLEEAKRRYPVGTVYKGAGRNYGSYNGMEGCSIVEDVGEIRFYMATPPYKIDISGKNFLYYEGEWAEIIERPPQESNPVELPEHKTVPEEDFIVGGYIRLTEDYKEVPKGTIGKLVQISEDKELATFSYEGLLYKVWTKYKEPIYYRECEWVGMTKPIEELPQCLIEEKSFDFPGIDSSSFNVVLGNSWEEPPKKQDKAFDENQYLNKDFNKKLVLTPKKVKTKRKSVLEPLPF